MRARVCMSTCMCVLVWPMCDVPHAKTKSHTNTHESTASVRTSEAQLQGLYHNMQRQIKCFDLCVAAQVLTTSVSVQSRYVSIHMYMPTLVIWWAISASGDEIISVYTLALLSLSLSLSLSHSLSLTHTHTHIQIRIHTQR